MTTTTTNLTYPISPMILTRNTTELRQVVQQHVAADSVIQGNYWDGSRGCFIGCLNHSDDPTGAEKQYGLPVMVQRIAESIFERLPSKDAVKFFAALPNAIGCDGKDLSRIGWQFLAQALRNMPPQPAEIQAVVDPVIAGLDLLAAGKKWPAAAVAANAAYDAANVAYAAANVAYAAADAANAAAYAAYAADVAAAANVAANAAAVAADAAAANVAAWVGSVFASAAQQRDLLLRLINNAPVV